MVTTTRDADSLEGAETSPQPGLITVLAAGVPAFEVMTIGEPLELGRRDDGREDDLASRRHARIDARPGGARVTDLASRNGTFVDGERIAGAVDVDAGALVRTGASLHLVVDDVNPYLDRRMQAGEDVRGPLLQQTLEHAERVAHRSRSLLIYGETGTGKELVAQTFHRAGPHARGPFVAVNCAAIPESVAERLLFGAVRGAYSGASADAAGYVAAAEDGTLFLDEVGELHAAVQAKLLRVLETGELMPLGAARARQCTTQFCFATLRNLRERAADGSFRADLFYRLERAHLIVPPLRARREEIPWLMALELGRHDPGLTVHPRLVEACLLRPWPGNVRELLLAVGRAAEQAIAAGTTVVHPRHLDEAAGQPVAMTGTMPRARLDDLSSADVKALIERHQGNLSAVARELGIHRSLLYRALDRLGIKR